MAYSETLLGLLPPVSYNRTDPRIRAQAQADGAALDTVQHYAGTTLDAADPRTGILTDDWERVLGLDGSGKTRQARTAAVMAKLNETGGLSIPYFVGLAAAAGYRITVTEPQPFRAGANRAGDRLAPEDIIYVWQVNIANGNNRVYRFRAGASAAGERLTDYGDTAIETLIRDLKPAHTEVRFTYEA